VIGRQIAFFGDFSADLGVFGVIEVVVVAFKNSISSQPVGLMDLEVKTYRCHCLALSAFCLLYDFLVDFDHLFGRIFPGEFAHFIRAGFAGMPLSGTLRRHFCFTRHFLTPASPPSQSAYVNNKRSFILTQENYSAFKSSI
jgi:hypothetical protein